MNVLVPGGQTVVLPQGTYNRLYILATAVGGDAPATIGVGPNTSATITVHEWQGPVGQWDSRLKEPRQLREVYVAPMTPRRVQSAETAWTADAIQADLVVSYDPATGKVNGIDQIRPGFLKRDEIAWVGTHRHAPEGNQPYIPTYLFLYQINLPVGVRELRLPNNERVRILAMTAVREPFRVWPATVLYASDLAEPTGTDSSQPSTAH
jgi:alpha-mannosidase